MCPKTSGGIGRSSVQSEILATFSVLPGGNWPFLRPLFKRFPPGQTEILELDYGSGKIWICHPALKI